MTETAPPATRSFSDMTVVVATLGTAYVASMFLRNSIGVIAPNLAADLALTAPQIALISSIYFFAFVAAQIPLGIAIDRYGPKRCMLACAVMTVLSTLLFAGATSFGAMVAARVLMGLGTSCFLMAPLALYARIFPPDRFSVLTGLQLGIGAAGGLLATAPLAYATALIGWRASFAIMAAAVAGLGLLVAALIHDRAQGRSAGLGAESVLNSLRGVVAAWRCPDVGRLFLLNLSAYSSYVLVVGLWGGPYLTHVYGYGLKERGTILFVAATTQALAMIAWGATDRLFKGYKLAVYLGGGSTMALLMVVGFAGKLSPLALWAWFAAFGLGLHAGSDRPRQGAVPPGSGRPGDYPSEHGHHGGRLRVAAFQRPRHGALSGRWRGLSAGRLPGDFPFASGACRRWPDVLRQHARAFALGVTTYPHTARAPPQADQLCPG
jgi:MFS family permease